MSHELLETNDLSWQPTDENIVEMEKRRKLTAKQIAMVALANARATNQSVADATRGIRHDSVKIIYEACRG